VRSPATRETGSRGRSAAAPRVAPACTTREYESRRSAWPHRRARERFARPAAPRSPQAGAFLGRQVPGRSLRANASGSALRCRRPRGPRPARSRRASRAGRARDGRCCRSDRRLPRSDRFHRRRRRGRRSQSSSRGGSASVVPSHRAHSGSSFLGTGSRSSFAPLFARVETGVAALLPRRGRALRFVRRARPEGAEESLPLRRALTRTRE
jgi:hypothetical protein